MPRRQKLDVSWSGRGVIALLLSLLVVGCSPRKPVAVSVVKVPVFPPQQVVESGNYAEFLTENEKALQHCGDGAECDTALFNLGFVHAYAPKPHRDLIKALQYFDELRSKYPQSPYAVQGKAWSSLIAERIALEESQRKLQSDLRSKEASLKNLQERLKRSRAIDIEMQKRERELLR
jgi:hypothetical protein